MLTTEKHIVRIFMFFIFAMLLMVGWKEYLNHTHPIACTQLPSRSVLDATHAKENVRILCGSASPFIPTFCDDKLGHGINSIPALLIKR